MMCVLDVSEGDWLTYMANVRLDVFDMSVMLNP